MAEYYTSETGRTLPTRFEADINSKILHLICRVVIESPEKIYISTHKMNFDGNYYKPLLLKNPTMKQSVGLEDGKFKISTLNLSISNFEYEGEIFSDILKDVSLINTKAKIFFQTQTAETSDDTLEVYVGEIRKINHTSSIINITIEDYTQHKTNIQLPKEIVKSPQTNIAHVEKYRGKPIPMVYGHVWKAPAVIDAGGIIKADYKDVELVTSGEGDYAGMGNDHFYSAVESEVFDNEIIHPLWIYSGNSYVNIMRKGRLDLPQTNSGLGFQELGIDESIVGVEQYSESSAGRITYSSNFLMKHNVMQGTWYGKAGKVSLTKRASGGATYLGDDITGLDNPDNFGERINSTLADGDYTGIDMYDANGFYPAHNWLYDITTYPSYVNTNAINQNLMRLRIETKPDYNGYGFNSQIAINGHRFPFLKQSGYPVNNFNHIYALIREDAGVESQIADGSLFANINVVIFDGEGVSQGLIDDYAIDSDPSEWNFNKVFGYPDFLDYEYYRGLPDDDPQYENLILIDQIYTDLDDYVIPYLQLWNFAEQGYFDIYFGISGVNTTLQGGPPFERQFEQRLAGSWAEVDMKSIIDVKDALTSNVYLNIDGRRGGNGVRLSNAIEILNDIAIGEMNLDGFDDIDSDSYNEAIDNNNINLAFSVNEFIKAKDLFEDISRSTMCFPYFKSNGQLGFPTIKNSYSFDDYQDSFSIDRKDIINYSFSKTPSEKVYTRVDVKYKIDYETNEYLSRISDSYGAESNEGTTPLSLDDHQLEYYGYEDSEENLLEFESKYIRELDSARELADKLFHYNRNQHLKVKLKLPLKYIAIEVGSIISFKELIEDRLAYGINYSKVDNPFGGDGVFRGGQYFYPLFFVSSVNISYTYIEIEATQLHYLEEGIGAINDESNWIDNDLYLFSEYEPPEEEEIEEEDFELIDAFNIDPEGLNAFQTVHAYPTITNLDILHWLEPSAFGVVSFNELIPTDWSNYHSWQIRDYEAIKFSIACVEIADSASDNPTSLKAIVTLGNISGSGLIENFEMGWSVQIVRSYDDEVMYGDIDDWLGEGDDLSEYYIMSNDADFPSAFNTHTIELGYGLKTAIDEGLVGFDLLTFYAGIDIIPATIEFGLGDVNADSTINILDIVALVNFILGQGSLDSPESGDVNQDGMVNILDIIFILNQILYGTD